MNLIQVFNALYAIASKEEKERWNDQKPGEVKEVTREELGEDIESYFLTVSSFGGRDLAYHLLTKFRVERRKEEITG